MELLQGGKAACAQCWIYQTWTALNAAGFSAQLTTHFPEEGIVVALAGNLAPGFRPPEGVFLVGVAADGLPHPSAQCHILQNRASLRFLREAVFMPLWPQPGLVARDPARGEQFQKVAFYGDPPNLAPEIAEPAFAKRLAEDLHLDFEILPAPRWHDYSQTDCAIAIRSFSNKPYLTKPSTKMINAWLAGVPFLGGMDSAFASDGRPGANYLPCPDLATMLAHLKRLQSDPVFRASLVEAGHAASIDFSPARLTRRWIDFLENDARARARRWLRSGRTSRALSRLHMRVATALFARRIS